LRRSPARTPARVKNSAAAGSARSGEPTAATMSAHGFLRPRTRPRSKSPARASPRRRPSCRQTAAGRSCAPLGDTGRQS
jgi:hypothetical protein